MTKKIVSDIIINKKSIRQIPVSLEKKRSDSTLNVEDFRTRFHIPKDYDNRKPLNPKFVLWLIALLCILAVIFSLSMIFASVTLNISPKIEEISLTADVYNAKLNGTGLNIPFETIQIQRQATETVIPTDEQEVSKKAVGTIIIYNNFSSASQRLINNTRFENALGQIYRINNSVVVPGTKIVGGKTVPGSIEAEIFADEPGEEFNLKLEDMTGDFTIPGFKGSPRYDAFYARLKTDITGGLVGKQKIVAEAVRKEAEEKLKNNLTEQLIKEMYAVTPDEYIIFDQGYEINFQTMPDGSENDKAIIRMTGELNGIIFHNHKLAQVIATHKIPDFNALPVKFIYHEDDLTVQLRAKDGDNLWTSQTVELLISGTADIQWLYDPLTIKKDLAGKHKSDIKNILIRYQNSINSIQVLFQPSWTKYYPDNLEKIKIKETI